MMKQQPLLTTTISSIVATGHEVDFKQALATRTVSCTIARYRTWYFEIVSGLYGVALVLHQVDTVRNAVWYF